MDVPHDDYEVLHLGQHSGQCPQLRAIVHGALIRAGVQLLARPPMRADRLGLVVAGVPNITPRRRPPLVKPQFPVARLSHGSAIMRTNTGLETMLPFPAVRAVHAGRRGVKQVVAAVAVPVIASDVYTALVPPAFKRASRALHPYRPDWRHRNPFLFAGQTHGSPAKVRLSARFGLCEVY